MPPNATSPAASGSLRTLRITPPNTQLRAGWLTHDKRVLGGLALNVASTEAYAEQPGATGLVHLSFYDY